ncbi:hypothetical protein J2S00_003052 [Caldalkalibacillus uzonensis]|uniref:Phage protein n=1 Tax=Caldalkalibacillus uzonensis TaxID=353224 RepID=A0ABU0CXK4_9BACI|nr:hypothetical protein [Caldalkalibacillus uzonensis]MDQ0340247.1 hypothetical protein [Caldalkalibacillus uzonensis]
MIKEALEYLVNMGNVTHEVDGWTYSTKQLHRVEWPTAKALEVYSLSGLVEYVKSKFDTNEKLMIHVVSPTEVRCFSALNSDCNRDHYVEAKAMLPDFSFGWWYDPEEFNIKLQSCFVENEDRNKMLKIVGNIKEEVVKTVGDDGVSQTVVAKTGVATVENVKVPNPVKLKPYRTFVDIAQPESEFIFRMKNGPLCALFEADGGAWKLEAMGDIQEYLENQLQQEIEEGKIVIIA